MGTQLPRLYSHSMSLHQFRRLVSSLVLVTPFVAAACGGGGAPSDAPAGPAVIAIDGSSTVYPVTEAVAEEFQKATPGTQVTIGRSGTGGGFQKFCRNESVISNASRPISATEIEACRTAGVNYIELPVAYDGLTVVVHPKNTWATSITVEELKKLWEPAAQGKVTRWNQVRPSWPNQEVHLFGPGVDSGTFDYFTEVINGKAKASRGDYTSSEDDNVLVQGVSGDPSSLGYMGLAYYIENKDRMKLVPVDDGDPANGAGAIEPSIQTVRGGTYRPLSRPLFIYANTTALSRPEVQKFVDYYVSKATELIQEVGYVPLSDAEQQLVRDRFAAKTAGTMYGASSTLSAHASLEERLKAK
jgi:phosphate transport system substrate-binding protein